MKEKCEEIWNEAANQNHQLIRLLTVERDEKETVFNFWNKIATLAADCVLEDKTAAEIISALIVAVFKVSVSDQETTRSSKKERHMHPMWKNVD